jgi:hypothetical protein
VSDEGFEPLFETRDASARYGWLRRRFGGKGKEYDGENAHASHGRHFIAEVDPSM